MKLLNFGRFKLLRKYIMQGGPSLALQKAGSCRNKARADHGVDPRASPLNGESQLGMFSGRQLKLNQ